MNLLFMIMLNAMAIGGYPNGEYPNEEDGLDALIEENSKLCMTLNHLNRGIIGDMRFRVLQTVTLVCTLINANDADRDWHFNVNTLLKKIQNNLSNEKKLQNLWGRLLPYKELPPKKKLPSETGDRWIFPLQI
eukprot:NODE_851_length_3543_cov_0.476771.p4 type:complete len:133 gc:universal NODE_851_length_3543_cov_0.476771:1811-1413(-)